MFDDDSHGDFFEDYNITKIEPSFQYKKRCIGKKETIYTKENDDWTVEEITKVLEKENHPAVNAIKTHNHEKLREILGDGTIDVKTFKTEIVTYSTYHKGGKHIVKCFRKKIDHQGLLIDYAFFPWVSGMTCNTKVVGCLVSFGAELKKCHLSQICKIQAGFCKELLLSGSLQPKHILELREFIRGSQIYRFYFNIPEKELEANENEILNALDFWSEELLLLYCFEKKQMLLVF